MKYLLFSNFQSWYIQKMETQRINPPSPTLLPEQKNIFTLISHKIKLDSQKDTAAKSSQMIFNVLP